MSFADSLDMAYTIKYDLQVNMNRIIPLPMYRYSLSLFHLLTKANTTTEKRLMIDFKCIYGSYKKSMKLLM